MLRQYHLTLQRLQHEDIELVRQGRNLDFVRQNHVYQKPISPEEQEIWFQKINNKQNYFFLIKKNDRKAGIVYLKDGEIADKRGTCGMFIWDRKFLGSRMPILANIIGLDFFFEVLGNSYAESVVLKTNTPAMRMNEFLGFDFEYSSDNDTCRIFLTLEKYLGYRPKLVEFAEKLIHEKNEHKLRITGEVSDLNVPSINSILANNKKQAVQNSVRVL